jgi:predicted Zn-dependent protease
MFRKLALTYSISLFFLWLLGCSTAYNAERHKEETILIGTDKEVKIGENISEGVKRKFKFSNDPEVNKRVFNIGQKIANVCERKEVYFQFFVLEEEEVNAFSLPGGFIYVNSGLVKKVKNDDELAAVLAHEAAHVAQRHAIKRLENSLGYSALRLLTLNVPQDELTRRKSDIAFMQLILSYSREDEIEADSLSVQYLRSAEFDPSAILSFLTTLKDIQMKESIKPKIHFRTHPYISERIASVKNALYGRRDFNDYINIMEN